jgi:hypothetical protein
MLATTVRLFLITIAVLTIAVLAFLLATVV